VIIEALRPEAGRKAEGRQGGEETIPAGRLARQNGRAGYHVKSRIENSIHARGEPLGFFAPRLEVDQ